MGFKCNSVSLCAIAYISCLSPLLLEKDLPKQKDGRAIHQTVLDRRNHRWIPEVGRRKPEREGRTYSSELFVLCIITKHKLCSF